MLMAVVAEPSRACRCARLSGSWRLAAVALAICAFAPGRAKADEHEVVVTIAELTALDAADTWLAGPDDFYARVTIDGEAFTTPIKRQQNMAAPNWKVSKMVDKRRVDVRIELFDKDIGKADDKIDINRVAAKRDLDFVVDIKSCRVEGFSEPYQCSDDIRRAGDETKKAEIIFYVDVDP
jgi:hypothetical protein